ncbi:MAG: SH3 domain-containing protein [Clostridia bacterium]|nr:SH3 domain-containing protein [Clostridia bacterium]
MKKKLGLMLVIALLMISVCALASATTYYVTGNSVRVRLGPSTDSEIIGHYSRGERVEVQWISNGWACIYYGSYGDGYISSKYLSKSKPSSNPKPSSSTTTTSTDIYKNFVTVNYQVIVNPTNNYVNMRWAPTKSAQVVRIYYYGAPLTVIAENGTWCQVRDETTGTVGFMMKSLLLRIN